jgi:hypothetical protein
MHTYNLSRTTISKSFPCKIISVIRFAVALIVVAPSYLFGQIAPTSATSQWVPILYLNSFPDATNDLQTGTAEGDIVGNAGHPSLYMKYNDGGTPGPTNGWIGFRMRLGADANPPGFKGAAFVGVDADLNGTLDLFVGVNNQGSGNRIGIWNPGNGLNVSPNTTTLVSPPIQSYTETASNYGFNSINSTIDPFATSFDLDTGGSTDQFLTFIIPFSELVARLAQRGFAGFTKDTPMQLVAATATQDNSLNQDLNAVFGAINSTNSWSQLGGFSQLYSFSGTAPVPEPGTYAMMGIGLLTLVAIVRRKRR